MAKFVLEIDCDNSALQVETRDDYFDADSSVSFEELSRLISDVSDRVRTGDTAGRVRDYNGNTVGKFDFRLV